MHFSTSAKLSIPEHVRSVVFDEKDGFPSSVTLLNYETEAGRVEQVGKLALRHWYFSPALQGQIPPANLP